MFKTSFFVGEVYERLFFCVKFIFPRNVAGLNRLLLSFRPHPPCHFEPFEPQARNLISYFHLTEFLFRYIFHFNFNRILRTIVQWPYQLKFRGTYGLISRNRASKKRAGFCFYSDASVVQQCGRKVACPHFPGRES